MSIHASCTLIDDQNEMEINIVDEYVHISQLPYNLLCIEEIMAKVHL